MSKNIVAIDFTILGDSYLSYFQDRIKEFNYDFRDSSLNLDIDLSLYKLLNDFILQLDISKENIHFLYRQEDILTYLKFIKDNNTRLYNIDFMDDTKEYSYIVSNSSWVKYAMDNNLINDYRWIYGNNSNLKDRYYELSSIFDIDLTLIEHVDELFIALSPEYIPIKYHWLFELLVKNISVAKRYEYVVYEDFLNRLAYRDKQYDYTNCYVTLLCNKDYLFAVLGLKASLDAAGCKYPLIVLVSDLVDKKTLSYLDNYDIRYYKIKDLREKENKILVKNNFSFDPQCVINKIHCFSTLKDYNNFLYLDADSIVTKNIDYLLEEEVDDNIHIHDRVFLAKSSDKIFKDKENIEKYCKYDLKIEPNSIFHNNTKDKYWFDFKYVEDVFSFVNTFLKNNKNFIQGELINDR